MAWDFDKNYERRQIVCENCKQKTIVVFYKTTNRGNWACDACHGTMCRTCCLKIRNIGWQ